MNTFLLLERLQNERDAFELLLNRVGFARRLTMRGASGSLSIKDLLADILSREQFIADRLHEILHGETYSPSASFTALEKFHKQYGYPDYESPLTEKGKPDHLLLEKYRNIALDEIVEQELAAYGNILETAAQLTQHQYLDHDLYHRIGEHTYRPWRRMGAMMRRWMKQNIPEQK